MKINTIFLGTNVLIPNEVHPLGEKCRNPRTQSNKKIEMLRTSLRRSYWNPIEEKIQKFLLN